MSVRNVVVPMNFPALENMPFRKQPRATCLKKKIPCQRNYIDLDSTVPLVENGHFSDPVGPCTCPSPIIYKIWSDSNDSLIEWAIPKNTLIVVNEGANDIPHNNAHGENCAPANRISLDHFSDGFH